MNDFNIKKLLGFGCMRLPMKSSEVDCDVFSEMIDTFIASGFNYFDTAHGYIEGKSETAIKKCLTSRYPADSYLLANKLSTNFFKKEEDIIPFFESQLELCGVEYFDFYLMHAQTESLYEKYKACRAYEIALELLSCGKIKHFGISFHDKPEVLEKILTENPHIEFVQIQFNYIDYEDASVQSKNVYEVCRRFGKPVIIMEPVKGGCLADLPDDARAVLDRLGTGSDASYAIRYAAGFEGVVCVLSGMGDMSMMNDNIGYMKDFKPLDEIELKAVERVAEILRSKKTVACTGCKYCTERCPTGVKIPSIFACMNSKKAYRNWNSDYYYGVRTKLGGKASECIKCGACEEACPQHLNIRELLDEAVEMFEKK